ncbi:hypothetical protein KIH74_05355 [Kineosporia sp. J2-2]|uniref:Aminoglycoside phosphotransferase domain-containing protein n=1 Tax=Kineosporia corallincola TaxID=2835133 RepID=A0ABS5TFF5_9ACTN|nr:phosphotransferase [Kineosporia corallincola]MBT0768339.1 hypothetical protein [Kineosporia corallincola]
MRRTAETEDLSTLVPAALGPTARITGIERLRGGTRKGVYRVHLAPSNPGPASVIVYSWAAEENFWPGAGTPTAPATTAPAAQDEQGDPFAPATGLRLFLTARDALDSAGVRTVHVHLADDSHRHYRADVAVVEDAPGGTLEHLLYRSHDPADHERGRTALKHLAHSLTLMRQCRAPGYGPLGHASTPREIPCEQLILEHALGHLDEAADRDHRLGAVREPLRELLHTLRAPITPRTTYSLIHGELGPDHVLVDDAGQALLIDIEGLKFFDAEWEHVFLQIRFSPGDYALLAGPPHQTGLDPARMALYRLAMRLSLVAGPLRLLDGDFPDREGMQAIAESNVQATLALLAQERARG